LLEQELNVVLFGRLAMVIDIYKEVLSVLQASFDIDPSTVLPSSRLREDLDLDSIDLFDMIGVIEKRLGVNPELSDFTNAKTVSDFVEILSQLPQQTPNA
jgi:acyl carrier protein